MKTILVPTDFSEAANHALDHAVVLAKQLHARLLLANAILVPIPVVTPAGIDIPFEGTGEILDSTLGQLQAIKKCIEKAESSDILKPPLQVSVAAGFGPPFAYIAKLAGQQAAGLVVAGRSGAGAMHRFFLGSTSRDLINVSAFPVLLIPLQAPLRPVCNIVFVSDLSATDIDAIRILVPLARTMGAKIRIAHICGEHDTALSSKIETFMARAKDECTDVELHYQSVYNRAEEEGFEWLLEHMKVDWFVMVHRHHGFLNTIFKEGYCQKMAKQSTVPVLVIPEHFHPKN